MIDPQLLEILVCPENHTTVTPADADLVAKINAAVSAGKLLDRKGDAIDEPVEACLVREDGKYGYAVREDIPNMLIDEAIPLDQLG